MIKVVVFDLDDTLFPEHQFVMSGFRAVSNWLATKYSVHDFFEVAWQFFQKGIRKNIFNLALEKIKVKYESHLILELVQIYRQHEPSISLYEDAKWAINHFKINNKLGILTDGYLPTQQKKVEALCIESKFDAIIYSELYGRENWKPSPLPYQKMMELLGCHGKDCVYVGDNPVKDFVTAKNLGWLTVQICRQGGEYSQITMGESHEANFRVESLMELKNLI
ncbi:MAG: HAD family hydrolase [Aulosira sp. DedQUE10]|nr:HAD family hydrolase [Aulosira sp. DedQUE10]